MNLSKKDMDIFFILWLQYDRPTWTELRDIQVVLLTDRFIKNMSFAKMAEVHGTTEGKIRDIFTAILLKIHHHISPDIAAYLTLLNSKMERPPEKPFEVMDIYLN